MKKKVAKKKTATKTIRPPKQVFISYDAHDGRPVEVYPSKKAAVEEKFGLDLIAGPYVLVERVRNK